MSNSGDDVASSSRSSRSRSTRSTVDLRRRSIHEFSKEYDVIDPRFLSVRTSSIEIDNTVQNKGLFAEVPLKEGAVVGEYTGRPVDPKTRHTGDYVMSTSKGLIEAYEDTLMRYVNHRWTKDGPNVITRELLAPLPRVFLVTTRHVKKDEELTFDYGSDYIWKTPPS